LHHFVGTIYIEPCRNHVYCVPVLTG